MNVATRVSRFSFVGAIGIGVQLGVLAVLVELNLNYLLATSLAVESAVLHNFFWHQRFTWVDRPGGKMLARLLRFHVSNGLISLIGNLLLMRLLVGGYRVPVMLANMLAISTCFVANFLASDRWVFRHSPWLAEPGGALLGTVAHQNKCPLRKRDINERSCHRQGQPQADLRSQ